MANKAIYINAMQECVEVPDAMKKVTKGTDNLLMTELECLLILQCDVSQDPVRLGHYHPFWVINCLLQMLTGSENDRYIFKNPSQLLTELQKFGQKMEEAEEMQGYPNYVRSQELYLDPNFSNPLGKVR